MSGDGPITERGDPRDRIANQRPAPPVTARHDKATEGRTEAAAVDRAIKSLGQVLVQYERAMVHLGWTMVNVRSKDALRVLADAVEELRLSLYSRDILLSLANGRLEAAEADRDEAERLYDEAEQRLTAMEAERDFLLSDPDNVAIKEWHDRLARQVADLEAALREIENLPGWPLPHKAIARAALVAARSRDPQEPFACACIGPPVDDGDPRCVCAREFGWSRPEWDEILRSREQGKP